MQFSQKNMAKVRFAKAVYLVSLPRSKRRIYSELMRRPPIAGAPPPLVPERELPPIKVKTKKPRALIRARRREATWILVQARTKNEIVPE